MSDYKMEQNTNGGNVVGNVVNGHHNAVHGSHTVNLNSRPAELDSALELLARLENLVAQNTDMPKGKREDVLDELQSASKALQREEPDKERAVEKLTLAQRTLAAFPTVTSLAGLALQVVQMLRPPGT